MADNASGNTSKKIFVVDDDSSIGEILSSILILENYDVSAFIKGSDAVVKSKDENVDLILLDYFLPGENTEDIINEFRGNKKDTPIILMSASVQGEQMAKKLNVNEFIPKPFQREVLLETIQRNIL